MAKAKIKTVETAASVDAFINAQKDAEVRSDCRELVRIMRKATGEPPRMWGTSLVGFGNRVFTSPATGRQVDWFLCGFSPRKQNLSLHLMPDDLDRYAALLNKLGRHGVGRGCLYIKRLADVDMRVLEQLVNTLAGASMERAKEGGTGAGPKATKKRTARART